MDALRAAGALEVNGLPLHPLIVHAVVILVPLTALAVVLGTVWPAARRRLGIVTPLGALVVTILVPVTYAAGESLFAQVGPVPGVEQHETFGRMLLPWVIAMLVLSAGQWAWYRWGVKDVNPAPTRVRVISVIIGALAIIAAVGSVVVVVLAGESGSRAVWGGLG